MQNYIQNKEYCIVYHRLANKYHTCRREIFFEAYVSKVEVCLPSFQIFPFDYEYFTNIIILHTHIKTFSHCIFL